MSDQTTPNPIDTITQALQDLAAAKDAANVLATDLKYVEFSAKKTGSNVGKGLIFTGDGNSKQLVLHSKPESHFYSSESISIHRSKNYMIDGVPVLSGNALGSQIVKSSLREVGRLRGLVVEGSVNLNDYVFYNGDYDRLGIGIESPNAALSVAEMGVEVIIGTSDDSRGVIGTFASNGFDIVTGNVPRISISTNGNIQLGNPNRNPIQVSINGKLSVGVDVPDPAVDLHVSGPVRLNDHLQMYASTTPTSGSYTVGDIIWNNNPRVGGCVGWICVRAGSPGVWCLFGEIKPQGNT